MGQRLHKAVSGTLASLSTDRPIFHSEADFQHAFAVRFHEREPGSQIRLERPFRIPSTRVVYVDLLIQIDGHHHACELKYITRALIHSVGDEDFHLKSQGAQDLRRYDVLKDVVRVETLIKHGAVQSGGSITLTNDASMWAPVSRPGTIDELFRFSEGRTVAGELAWARHASPGTIRNRTEPLRLSGEHTLIWSDYSKVEAPRNGVFRALHIPLG